MRILVTGAGGQIGSDLVRALAEDPDNEVHGSDIAPRPALMSVTHVPWHQLDVTNRHRIDEVLIQVRPDVIFHLAGILSARGEEMPQVTYAVNQGGMYNLLEACREHGIKRFVFTSTIAVYGPGLPEHVHDDAPLRPTTIYGVTKVGAELLGEYYQRRFELDFRGVRFPGLISASMPGGGTSDYALFMYVEGVRTGAYEAFCSADTRIPLMYMPDGIRSLVELAKAPKDRLTRCIYNVAAFSPTAQEIAQSVASRISDVNITFAPDPLRQSILDSWPRYLDDRSARNDWGWKPHFDLDAMTEDLIPRIRGLLATNAAVLDPNK